jgi:two-component sensor histidine kinase
MEDLLRFLLGPRPLVVRYGATAVMVLATFGLRLVIQDRAGPYEFMLFVPAIVASALLFDRGTGFFALGLSAVLDATLFPWNQDPQVHIGAIVVFLMVGSGLVLMSEGLHRALERANKAEREAQLLLSEMSHRVKNKFAMVVSMIALQARQSPPETRAALEAIDSRVRVIAKVHDYLQHSRHEGLVNMREYLLGLCQFLEEALCSLRLVKLFASAEPIVLPPDRALSIGLIVNELVTNALKYAFPDDRTGRVEVLLEKRDGLLCLSVADDGVGCTEQEIGLGTKLVKLLAAQLGGEARWQSLHPGCRASVVMPGALELKGPPPAPAPREAAR